MVLDPLRRPLDVLTRRLGDEWPRALGQRGGLVKLLVLLMQVRVEAKKPPDANATVAYPAD